jgi:hypothetical protein
MLITIIADEELTHNVFDGFKNFFDVNALGHLFGVLFNEGVDTLATIFLVADLDGVDHFFDE